MKALISDDESPVRDSIQLLMDWNKFGITKVFEAENGAQAIEIIREEHPEIIFTDIRMPLKDGLSLMEWLKENETDAKVIVISGYSDFEYVQHSLRNGAVDYLLKPINPSHLQDAVNRAIDQISQRSKIKDDYKKQQKDLNDLLSEIERSYFMKNLEGTAESQYTVHELKNRFPDFMTSKPFLLVYLELSLIHVNRENPFSLHWKKNMAEICRKIRLEVLKDQDALPLYSANNHPYIIVLVSNPGDKYDDIYQSIIIFMEKVCGIRCSSVCSMHNELTPEIIVSSMKNIKSSVFNKFYQIQETGRKRIAISGELSSQSLFDMPMKFAVRNRNIPQVEKLIDLWLDSFNIEELSFRNIKIIHDDIFLYMRKWFMEWDLLENYQLMSYLDLSEGYPCSILNSNMKINLQLLRKIMISFYSGIISCLPQYKTSEDELFNEIKSYIQNHCSEELSLSKIATLFFYSESFISKKFKFFTGLSYVEYLTQCRMVKAKTLLSNSDISVSEVARSVGYYDEKYFSRVFKKIYKQTPKQVQMKAR